MLEKYLSVNPGLVRRRRKVRGKKRFLEKIIREAKQYDLPGTEQLRSSGWHTHPDWDGYGNLSWDFREKYIEATCIIFKKFAENLHLFPEPYQLYIFLYEDGSNSDAVYFNVPDETNEYFPMKYKNVEWGVPDLEEYFSRLLAPHKIKVGCMGGGKCSDVIVIYSPDIGVPIE